MRLLVDMDDFVNLRKRFWKAVEVCEEIGVHCEMVSIHDFDFDGLTKVHGGGMINVKNYRVRNSDLDTFSHILSFENNLSNGFDPFITAGSRVGRQRQRLLVGSQFKDPVIDRIARYRIS